MKRIRLDEVEGPSLDLRSPDEFAAGHLPGAVNIPLEELPERLHELPPRGEPLLLYGPSAEAAARFLSQKPRWEIAYCDDPLPSHGLSREPGAPLWRPHPWLSEQFRRIPAGGRVFDVAMGTGRDAVFLALQGYRVRGEDILPEAVAKAKELARRNGVSIEAKVGDLTRPQALAPESCEGIIVFNYLDRGLLPQLQDALLPGGVLIYETFLKGQEKHGRPKNPDHLLEPGELKESFADLEILAYEEGMREAGRLTARMAARREDRAD